MVVIKPSLIHGKGVFAIQKIIKGTILSCDILPISSTDPTIQDYLFPYNGALTCLHIGFASFFNGSLQPNVKHIKVDINTKVSYFEVLNDINEGEELFLDYGGYK